MAEKKPFDPVFNRKSGDFADNSYEDKEESKNIMELYWMVPTGLGIALLILWIAFASSGLPFFVPLIVTIIFVGSIAAIPWFTNSK